MAEWRHRGTRAVQRIVEHAPSTGGLALWVRHEDCGDDTAAPVTTDGRTVSYAPAFESLPLPRQTALVAHVVLHVALRHPQRLRALQQRTGDVDAALFNACADAIVNTALAHLAWMQLPPGAVRLEQLLAEALGIRQAAEAALLAWEVERLYRAIDDRAPSSATSRAGARQADRGTSQPSSAAGGAAAAAPRRQDGSSQPAPGDDSAAPRGDGPRAARVRLLAAAMPPDLQAPPGEGDWPEDEAAEVREWHERIVRAHASDGEYSMLRALLADLPVLRTPWEQLLRVRLARALAQRPAPSWSRPTRSWLACGGRSRSGRRLPWEPGTASTRPVPRLAVVVDVSGSIDEALLDRFAAELDAITRRQGASMVVVVGDDRVRQVAHCEPGRSGLRERQVEGGGGTDFGPLLQEAQRHRPDITVVLTDLQGPAGFRPDAPVIWAVPEAWRHVQPPFGRLLVLQ